MSGIISYTGVGGRSGILGGAPWFIAREFPAASNGAFSGWLDSYGEVDQGPGGHFDNSTGRFTAPVPGVYLFTVQGIKNNRTSVVRLYIRKNELSPATLDCGLQIRLDDPDGGEYIGMSAQVIYRLTAGDFVSLFSSTGYLLGQDGELGNFTGHYIRSNT